MKLRIGTRGSALALAQANDVAARLAARGHEPKIEVISTTGDRVTDRAFTDVGAFGIFVREIEQALLDRRVDLAVHSYKDLPSTGPDALVIAAVPEREDVADVLLIRADAYVAGGLLPLKAGAVVGTSAARRRALLLHHRPDLRTELLRGNVPTRMRALLVGTYDAIVLASAGLTRLQRVGADLPRLEKHGVVSVRLDPAFFVPAPSQGAIAVQVRADAPSVASAVQAIDDRRTALALRAERGALARAEAGCSLPFGAWCDERADGTLVLIAALADDGGVVRYVRAIGSDPDALADDAWAQLSAGRTG
ncbi:MAG TPA: hydroxymethylbilane synthase [Gemmatimonadaceae bacterium]|jgi:hydroxymethylbilane synthase